MGKINTLLRLLRKDPKRIKSALSSNLANSQIGHLIPDKLYLKIQYWLLMDKKLNLKSPKAFNEKLQWLKLYDRNPRYPGLVDKYKVKEYVAGVLGEQYVIPNLGIWDSVEDIDFDSLPNEFVIKCTHDSGSVIVCRDKASFNIEAAKAKLKKKFDTNLFWQGREWPYKSVQPRVLAEKYLSELSDEKMIDYKFFCFNGEPRYLYVSQGLEDHETARISYASLDWEIEPFKRSDFDNFETLPPKPKGFDKMIEMSKTLAKDIPFVRVDFYDINGQVYFGEMTFFPGAGYTAFHPDQWDEAVGRWLRLPQ